MAKVIFEPSGTNAKDEALRIRLDLIPEFGEKSFELGRPALLRMFVRVDPMINKRVLKEWVIDTLTEDIIASIDDAVVRVDAPHIISPLMRNRTMLSKARVRQFYPQDKYDINRRLKGFAVEGLRRGLSVNLPYESIDVGEDQSSSDLGSGPNTVVIVTNPANASGTIDTVRIWRTGDMPSTEFASFYGTPPTFSSRDSYAVGNLTGAAHEDVTGFTFNISTGDYLGCYWTSGATLSFYLNTGGGNGQFCYKSGDQIPCTSETFTESSNEYVPSLYGTGTEGGGIPIKMGYYMRMMGS